jgi:hypothetical protein
MHKDGPKFLLGRIYCILHVFMTCTPNNIHSIPAVHNLNNIHTETYIEHQN